MSARICNSLSQISAVSVDALTLIPAESLKYDKRWKIMITTIQPYLNHNFFVYLVKLKLRWEVRWATVSALDTYVVSAMGITLDWVAVAIEHSCACLLCSQRGFRVWRGSSIFMSTFHSVKKLFHLGSTNIEGNFSGKAILSLDLWNMLPFYLIFGYSSIRQMSLKGPPP